MDGNFDLTTTENILMVSIIFICIGTFFICLLCVICIHLYHLCAYVCKCIHLTSSEQCQYPDICERTLNEAQDIDKHDSATNPNCCCQHELNNDLKYVIYYV